MTHDEARKMRDFEALWRQKRGERAMPCRKDFDVLDLRSWLGNVNLIDVERGAARFRLRLVGTRIAALQERDCTGRYFDEFVPERLLGDVLAPFRQTVLTRVPAADELVMQGRAGPVLRCSRLVLPLSDDGVDVTMIMELMLVDSSEPVKFRDVSDGRITRVERTDDWTAASPA
jgi:hypothetical protein